MDIRQLHERITLIRGKAQRRDSRMQDVHSVRCGDIETIMPGCFPEAWPKPVVANVIDTTARDLAEVIAPLPSINCASGIMSSQRGKNFASKRTKIANYYVVSSNFKIHMIQAADYYITYGFVPYVPAFSGLGRWDSSGDPSKAAVGILRHAYEELIAE